MSLSSSTPNVI